MNENREHTNKSISRQVISASAGIVTGACAGSLVMNLLGAAAVASIANPSAGVKMIINIGRWGIGIATAMKVEQATEDIIESVFTLTDGVKTVAGAAKAASEAIDNATKPENKDDDSNEEENK